MGQDGGVVAAAGYRWIVLTVGTAAQTVVSVAAFGVVVLAPEIRTQFGLTLSAMGVVLAAFTIGVTLALIPWGMLTDRVGERVVLPLGLGTAALAVLPLGIVDEYPELIALLVLFGALSSSVNGASGAAVMRWFGPAERGLAFGIRQASVPLGGLFAALALPPLATSVGLGWTFFLAGTACLAIALAAALLLRDPAGPRVRRARPTVPARPLRRPALWALSSGGALIALAQTVTMSFTVLFLTEERGLSTGTAALVFALAQILGAALRILVGHRSDRRGGRIAPLCRLALVITGSLVLVAGLAQAPLWALAPTLVLAGAIGMSWNGLAFVSAAEIAGVEATGAAVGLQQTFLGVAAVLAPIGFAALVSATSWQTGMAAFGLFPLLGWALIRPLRPPAAERLTPDAA